MVRLPEGFSVPIPLDATPEQEANLVALFRKELDPEKVEAELKELLRLQEEGKLVSFEEVLRDLGVLDEAEEVEESA
ncbi:MAG: hypothetical protein L0Y72_17760 [Gemmataceae bacterium]|nr:hypothetical protein [Gemmataceae bacterium]